MKSGAQVETVDVSERFRELMNRHKLTVGEMAKRIGVSKSALEKYLAGPSSPRATAIVATCLEFEVSADWLLFGKTDPSEEERLQVLMFVAADSFRELLRDLKNETALSRRFHDIELGSSDWRRLIGEVPRERAIELLRDYHIVHSMGRFAIGEGVPLPGRDAEAD